MQQCKWLANAFLLSLLAMVAACACEKTETNPDKDLIPDIDSAVPDTDACPGAPAGSCEQEATTRCISNTVYQCVHVKNQSGCVIETTLKKLTDCPKVCVVSVEPEPGIAGVAECAEEPDIDRFEPDCPALSKAQFPYYTREGIIHFCRACDLPAKEDDPQCVRNLWDDAHKKLVKDFPDETCYPYPCQMQQWHSMYEDSICGAQLPPKEGYRSTGMQGWPHFGLSGSIAGFILSVTSAVPVNWDSLPYKLFYQATLFDLKSRSYTLIMPLASSSLGYNKWIVTEVPDYNTWKNLDTAKNANSYMIAYSSESGYKVIFNKPIDHVTYSVKMNDQWIYANILPKDQPTATPYYAKVGEWQWHELGPAFCIPTSISGNVMGCHTLSDGYQGYVCDLSKLPSKLTDCIKVTHGTDQTTEVILDKDNPNRFTFEVVSETVSDSAIIPICTITGNTYSCEDHKVPYASPYPYIKTAHDFKGDLLALAEVYIMNPQSDSRNSRICFYRISEQKEYCGPFDQNYNHEMGFSEFDGRYLVMQNYNKSNMKYADTECLCNLSTEQLKSSILPFFECPSPNNQKQSVQQKPWWKFWN